MTGSSYRARWRGDEYRANLALVDTDLYVRLLREDPADGFEATNGGWVRTVLADECEVVLHAVDVCVWRTVECLVLTERGEDVRLEYAGGSTPQARELGFERVERGVWRRWVRTEEIRGRRDRLTVLAAKE